MAYQPRAGKKYLQEFQIDYIIDNHGELSQKQIATAIGCSITTVWQHCKRLKIKCKKECFQLHPPVIPACVKPV